jgi:hypothetical protein
MSEPLRKKGVNSRASWTVLPSIGLVCASLTLLFLCAPCAYPADIVLARAATSPSRPQRQLQTAAEFYGVNLKVVTLSGLGDNALNQALDENDTKAVAIEAQALGLVDQKSFLLRMSHHDGVSLLIMGVTPETSAALLSTWSDGAVLGGRYLHGQGTLRYMAGTFEKFTHQLTGTQIPYPRQDACGLVLRDPNSAKLITTIESASGTSPVFIETTLRQRDIFLASAEPGPEEKTPEASIPGLINSFAELAPAFIFVRYSAAESAWHAINHYANLTIDDPWLREPYGNLSYRGLLAEMVKHNFHSTIAFIPWNYDRNKPEVVSLVRDNPERFSISIHGDNHDHKEFTDYSSRPLEVQKAVLRESLARMDRFSVMTGIPYDKVMVFPHSIAPEKTLAALRDENYLGTVNSSNVPMDTARPSDVLFDLRASTLSFGDFSSTRRYSLEGELPPALIRMNMFLDNPLLFYVHEMFFASGIGAFDAEADYVNKLQPETRWRGLGEVIRNLFVVKLRADKNYDVLSFAGTISLENTSGRDSVFFVRKEETERPAMVTVDGASWPYSLRGKYLETKIPIKAGAVRTLSISYRNSQDSMPGTAETSSFRIYCLRIASDFRDITLSRFGPGRSVIHLYEEHGRPLALVLAGTLMFVTVSCILGVRRLRLAMRNRVIG